MAIIKSQNLIYHTAMESDRWRWFPRSVRPDLPRIVESQLDLTTGFFFQVKDVTNGGEMIRRIRLLTIDRLGLSRWD